MAQFTLTWNNAAILSNPNSIGQRALYRVKSVGGSFLSTGFTPANDLLTSVTSVLSPTLDENSVHEFKIQGLCTVNGPTDNDNGIKEIISFTCIVPTLVNSITTASASINVANTDISKARFTLRKSSDNSILFGPVIIARVGDSIESGNATGLTASTNYYWQIELYSTVQGLEVISSNSEYLGAVCGPYLFMTDAQPVCNPVTSLTVNSIEIV